jgi:hypothetical protein
MTSTLARALFIVDSTGKTRPDSWHLTNATHPDFEKAVVKSIQRTENRWHWCNASDASCSSASRCTLGDELP